MFTVEQRAEWKRGWMVPVIGMMGIAGCVVKPFTSGVMIGPMTREFGWSRTEFSSAFALQMVVLLLVSPLVGKVIDTYGSRRVALVALWPALATIALLSTASGTVWQWQLLCVVQALAGAFVAAPVWVTAVTRAFTVSRGMALAVTLGGVALGSMMWPVLTAALVTQLGWRLTFATLAVSWGLLFIPLVFFFFPGPDGVAAAVQKTSAKYGWGEVFSALFAPPVLIVVLAGSLFTIINMGTNLHLVPILQDRGFGLTTAAGVAGVAGFSSLAGRLLTGLLLDRISTRLLGVVAFMLPVMPALLLMQDSVSLPVAIGAVMLFGLAAGAEIDVVTYMVSRRVSVAMFGSVYSVVSSTFAVCAGLGPLLASSLYDAGGNYEGYLIAIIPIVLTGACLIALAPRGREESEAADRPRRAAQEEQFQT